VLWGLVWGALPLGLQTWMSGAAPTASDGSLALFVTTIQLAIAGGSVVGGAVVTSLGIEVDFFIAGAIALVAIIVLLSLGRQRRTVASPTTAATATGATAVPCVAG